MMIDFGEAHVLEGKLAKTRKGLLGIHRALPDCINEIARVAFVHTLVSILD